MKRTADYLNEVARNSDLFHEMDSYEIKKLREMLLNMYTDIKNVGDKYGLKIMAAGGTCLGTVRHQGFIPWDDDLDLMLSREDYNKFIEVFDKELSDKYGLSVPKKDKQSRTLYMMMYKKGTRLTSINHPNFEDERNGVIIDLFPIEKMPDNKIIRLLKFKTLDLLRIIALSVTFYYNKEPLFKESFSYNLKSRIYYYIRKGIGFFFSIFGRHRLYELYDKFASSSTGTKYCSIPTGRGLSKKECHESEVFFPAKLAKFEGLDILLPNNPDSYLRSLYGDYMVIPPVEKREHHFYLKVDFGSDTK